MQAGSPDCLHEFRFRRIFCNFAVVKNMRLISIAFLAFMALTVAAQGRQHLPAGAAQSSSGNDASDGTSGQSSPKERQEWIEAITQMKAWRVSDPLGVRISAPIDTLMENYSLNVAVPSLQWGYASSITGNLGSEGRHMNYWQCPAESDFFFNDAVRPFLPEVTNTLFFNSRVPLTLVSYNTGGTKETVQDWLKVTFSGNINKRAQVGGWLSYLYSRGSYEHQAGKHFNWGLNGSYMGEHYQMMAMFNSHSNTNKENGGIEDDLYITDPAEVQGGNTSVRTKDIPVRLQDAQSNVNGLQLWMNHRYRVGYHLVNEKDSTATFVPVTQFFWTFDFRTDKHKFDDGDSNDDGFWENTYFTEGSTSDRTHQWVLSNAVGVQLLEGFKKWAKVGISAYARHEIGRYFQTPADTIGGVNTGMRPRVTENSLFIGGRIAKDRGAYIRYSADASLGIAGVKAGDFNVRGDAQLRLRVKADTLALHAYAEISNRKPSFFLREFVSNHFMWKNDFGRTRRVRFGGELDVPHMLTNVGVGVENVQNLIYFNERSLPTQHSGNVQVFWVTLRQDLKFGIFNWQNALTYQTSSNKNVIPLPQLTVYSNMFLLFRVATLRAQFGVDCNYTTRYSALGYQPATMSFTNANDVVVGNYPMCNVYLNMKLSKVRFYVMYSHFNQKLFGGSNYFSVAHYPLNPARFLFGLSVDFAN